MLVLTRKVGEKIHLGDNIVITVTSVSGQQVRIGISAPPDVPILRNELLVRAEAGATMTPETSVEEGAAADGKRSRPLRMFRPRIQEPV